MHNCTFIGLGPSCDPLQLSWRVTLYIDQRALVGHYDADTLPRSSSLKRLQSHFSSFSVAAEGCLVVLGCIFCHSEPAALLADRWQHVTYPAEPGTSVQTHAKNQPKAKAIQALQQSDSKQTAS